MVQLSEEGKSYRDYCCLPACGLHGKKGIIKFFMEKKAP